MYEPERHVVVWPVFDRDASLGDKVRTRALLLPPLAPSPRTRARTIAVSVIGRLQTRQLPGLLQPSPVQDDTCHHLCSHLADCSARPPAVAYGRRR